MAQAVSPTIGISSQLSRSGAIEDNARNASRDPDRGCECQGRWNRSRTPPEGISECLLDALENGRAGELGFSKVAKLLAALGLELTLQTAGSPRPTLDELLQEDRDDQSLDRRR